METNQDPPGRALPAGASPGLGPGAGRAHAAAVHLEVLRALIDEVVMIDREMAALALARAVAIDVGVELASAAAADAADAAALARSQRTPAENRRARRARGERGPRQ